MSVAEYLNSGLIVYCRVWTMGKSLLACYQIREALNPGLGCTARWDHCWCIIAAMNNVGLKEKGSIDLWLRRGLWVCGMAKSLERRPSAMWNLRRGGMLSAWIGNNRLSPWRFHHVALSNLEKWKSFASLYTFDSICEGIGSCWPRRSHFGLCRKLSSEAQCWASLLV